MIQILLIGIALLLPVNTSAHSGGLDYRGGHHCRTQCEARGMQKDEYHFHPLEMNSAQKKSYTRLKTNLCNRIEKRFSTNAAALTRVNDRIFRRFGFTCTVNAVSQIPSTANTEWVQIMRVIDGDTFEIRERDGDMKKLRLIGIDTPEVNGHGKKGECYGKEASIIAKQTLANRSVEIIKGSGDEKDKYGRLLRYIHFGGYDIGAALLAGGYARNYPWFSHSRLEEYKELEAIAKEEGKGLWGACE